VAEANALANGPLALRAATSDRATLFCKLATAATAMIYPYVAEDADWRKTTLRPAQKESAILPPASEEISPGIKRAAS
jgi:hypothetical protein